ncbi:metallophosphoesterase [Marivirga sp. S37H4]|uniref:Metallophosphoesterase n=1 Tax=Marivirga aurantiaca TaxID=2802615 RepID=A0A934WV99_9BACT|nr:metallophosphoesterase [Marivirga aurantiaca]MBK6263586.1 metallophosphoesterase [Marivirga aurantiaca]
MKVESILCIDLNYSMMFLMLLWQKHRLPQGRPICKGTIIMWGFFESNLIRLLYLSVTSVNDFIIIEANVMLKVQYCSDLHLEFPENKSFLDEHPIQANGDVLLMAGDIVPFAEMHKFESFFDKLSDQFKKVYWIPGNHEYYQRDIKDRSGSFIEEIRKNVYLLNNKEIELEGFRLIFTSLWSKLSEENFDVFTQQWPDFNWIKNGDGNFTPDDYNQLYDEDISFLKNAMSREKEDVTTIVITHHVPTFKNFPEKHKGSKLNEAFATELSDLIKDSAVDYWIHGHNHSNTDPFKIGETVMLTNQLGYVKMGEHERFSQSKTI